MMLRHPRYFRDELPWVTNPLPGTSEDHPPSGGKPSEVEAGEEPTAIHRRTAIFGLPT
jgi:hypothetical protein